MSGPVHIHAQCFVGQFLVKVMGQVAGQVACQRPKWLVRWPVRGPSGWSGGLSGAQVACPGVRVACQVAWPGFLGYTAARLRYGSLFAAPALRQEQGVLNR